MADNKAEKAETTGGSKLPARLGAIAVLKDGMIISWTRGVMTTRRSSETLGNRYFGPFKPEECEVLYVEFKAPNMWSDADAWYAQFPVHPWHLGDAAPRGRTNASSLADGLAGREAEPEYTTRAPERQMRLVKQQAYGECGLAAAATVLGVDLETVREGFPDACRDGVSEEALAAYLTVHGVPALPSLVWPSLRIPAILTVPSLNHPGVLHFVVWDGERILDPTHEALRYPDDRPDHGRAPGSVAPWASAILLWLPRAETSKATSEASKER